MRTHGLDEAALAATAVWLSGERCSSPRTQAGYARDLAWWLTYAAARGLDPADVPAAEADLYAAPLRAAGLADATRGRSEDELQRLLAYAATRESTRTYALLAVMTATGCWVSSVSDTTLGGLGRDRGHATLDLPVKGGATKQFVLPPFAGAPLDRYSPSALPSRPGATRTTASSVPKSTARTSPAPIPAPRMKPTRHCSPLAPAARSISPTSSGSCSASLRPPAWTRQRLSPHSLRHSVATLLLDRGHPLHVVQDFLGHADPRTTRRYDHARESLNRSPASDFGAALAAGAARHTQAYATTCG
ncbi:tyrosine-type recombinase/integrase [Actinomadura luteofluorescens]|uniref:tyrosine-type recombinase/integrase n=1 Tax=Actinomadura luteofluorescens TaxID=46163 RepID=UPI0030CD20F7